MATQGSFALLQRLKLLYGFFELALRRDSAHLRLAVFRLDHIKLLLSDRE